VRYLIVFSIQLIIFVIYAHLQTKRLFRRALLSDFITSLVFEFHYIIIIFIRISLLHNFVDHCYLFKLNIYLSFACLSLLHSVYDCLCIFPSAFYCIGLCVMSYLCLSVVKIFVLLFLLFLLLFVVLIL